MRFERLRTSKQLTYCSSNTPNTPNPLTSNSPRHHSHTQRGQQPKQLPQRQPPHLLPRQTGQCGVPSGGEENDGEDPGRETRETVQVVHAACVEDAEFG